MSVTPQYVYSPDQVTAVFNEIKATLFRGITAQATQITVYERGLGGLKKRVSRFQKTYTKDATEVTPPTAPTACSTYADIINNHVYT
jgi:hypothetical protein